MKKIRINFHYRYLGPDIGAVPRIYVGYVNDEGKELDSLEVLYDRSARPEISETDYTSKDLETIIKKAIIEVVTALGKGFEVSISNKEKGYCTDGPVEELSDLKKERYKNAVISSVGLNMEVIRNYGMEDKAHIMAIAMTKLFESVKRRTIGINADNALAESPIEFDIDGLNLDFIATMPNYTEVVYNVALNHVKSFNNRVALEMKARNEAFDRAERSRVA